MAFAAQAEKPPLVEDPDGALRIGTSRVLLELVVRAFQDGALPETIVQRYPTLKLSEVYSVIAYYLRHQNDVDAHLERCEQQATEIRQQIEAKQGDLSGIRTRLLARRPSQS